MHRVNGLTFVVPGDEERCSFHFGQYIYAVILLCRNQVVKGGRELEVRSAQKLRCSRTGLDRQSLGNYMQAPQTRRGGLTGRTTAFNGCHRLATSAHLFFKKRALLADHKFRVTLRGRA